MNANSWNILVLGEGVYSNALAQILNARQIADQSIRTGVFEEASSPSLPLLNCDLVFQVVTPREDVSTALWRHRTFWRMYGNLGGSDPRCRGLRWCVISCHPSQARKAFQQTFQAESIFDEFAWSSFDDGLSKLLKGARVAGAIDFFEWSLQQDENREESIRIEILKLLESGGAGDRTRIEVLRLAKSVSAFGWEAFCPTPRSHALANEIRKWLAEPVTDDVIPWVEKGRELFAQTNL